ncbi:MAG TPA: PH domain-containing protein [Candidatus Paceibacterota bacterium]
MIEIDKNERVLRIVRKHWFVLLGDLFLLTICLMIPVLLLFTLRTLPFATFFSWSGSSAVAQGFFVIAWLFIVWMIGWALWTNYYLDVLIVTDKRVFTIEQHGLFRRTSSSFRIDRIQNTTVEQSGIIQTLLGFGTIRLETASESENFVGTFITNPYEIKKFINEMHDTAVEKSQLVHTEGSASPVKGVAFASPLPHKSVEPFQSSDDVDKR